MIEQELLFLGLLKESPKHGYEIKRRVRGILSLFAGIDLKSIYYPLYILEQKGLVVKKISKDGKRPQRFVYELTRKGHQRFDELLTNSFLDFKRPQFSLDLSLYFLNYINPLDARRRLRGRIFILRRISKGLQQMLLEPYGEPGSTSLVRMVEHNRKMVDAELEFLEGLIKTL